VVGVRQVLDQLADGRDAQRGQALLGLSLRIERSGEQARARDRADVGGEGVLEREPILACEASCDTPK